MALDFMGRQRHQDGRIVETPNGWRLEWYAYVIQLDGKQKRAHRSETITGVSRTEARKRLQAILAESQTAKPDGSVTLRWFIENRWLPAKKSQWRTSTAGTNENLIANQITRPLGDTALGGLDKFRLQAHLNALAENEYSLSVIGHVRSFLKAILNEAQDSDYILKNPALRLALPQSQKPRIVSEGVALSRGKPFLSIDQLRALLGSLEGPSRLLVALCSIMAMRVGEALALAWSAYDGRDLAITQRIYLTRATKAQPFGPPKSDASMASLPAPTLIRQMLDNLKATDGHAEYIFRARGNGIRKHNRHMPTDKNNFLRRVLQPAGVFAVGTAYKVNFQTLRRTFATLAPEYGADLKVVESVLRHAASKNFTVGTYQQVLRRKVLDCFDKFSEAALGGLPEQTTFSVVLNKFEQAPSVLACNL